MSATDAKPVPYDRIAYAKRGSMTLYAHKCPACNSMGYTRQKLHSFESAVNCEDCDGAGWLNINPHLPTTAPPGTVEKSVVLQVRYAHGLDPWNPDDETSRADENDWHPLRPIGEGHSTHGNPHEAHDLIGTGDDW